MLRTALTREGAAHGDVVDEAVFADDVVTLGGLFHAARPATRGRPQDAVGVDVELRCAAPPFERAVEEEGSAPFAMANEVAVVVAPGLRAQEVFDVPDDVEVDGSVDAQAAADLAVDIVPPTADARTT